MALFEVYDYDRKIWEEELKDFLPDRILDVHTHVYKREFFTPPKPGTVVKLRWPSLVASEDPIEDLQETYDLLFPGKDVKALMFVSGRTGLDQNNAYLSEVSRKTGWPALYYSRPTESADEVEQNIREGGFLGVKSYLNLAPSYIPTGEVRILDFFPKHQLERLNEMGAICMCHIPRDLRLKDPVNVAQIAEIKELYPKLRLIIAHIGRAYVKEDIGNAFETLDKYPTLLYDFSANCCDFAIRTVIEHAGVKNVMYGTDMPILRMRTHRIEENGTYINLVPPGLYGGAEKDPHLREVSEEEAKTITFFVYEELLSLKRVAKELNLTREDVYDLMYGNAMNMIKGARADIYGK